MSDLYRKHSGYFNRAFGNIDTIADEMLEAVKEVDFDTMVGTGLSGTLVVPTLARAFGTYWAIVRKEKSIHAEGMIEGEIGQRWLFVDDFISSGETLQRVKDVLSGLLVSNYDESSWSYQRRPHHTKYVGTYQYERKTFTL